MKIVVVSRDSEGKNKKKGGDVVEMVVDNTKSRLLDLKNGLYQGVWEFRTPGVARI